MRIIFLNCWHGKVWTSLKKFISNQAGKTDIFCFVEVDPGLQAKLGLILHGFTPTYSEGIKTTYLNGIVEGRSIFVKDYIKVVESGTLKIYRPIPTDAGGFLYTKLRVGEKDIFIGSIHGKARPGSKDDTPVRLKQSDKIIQFFAGKSEPKIIGGDFNLNPDTLSIKKFEEAGYRNLIKDFKIKNTRNRLSWEQFKNIQYFADYVFTSSEVKINSFKVPNLEISDHLPLIVDFEI
jgi:hypothetical protein